MTNSQVGTLTAEVAAILRGARGRAEISQAALAESAGVSQSQMSKMLRGARTIDLAQLERMCVTLRLDMTEVIREAEANTIKTGDLPSDTSDRTRDFLRDKQSGGGIDAEAESA